ncbi:hypothetical protein ABPG77_002607 [Micractinium sp. CCAP 211/92]
MVEWELDVPLPAVPPTHIEENYRSLYAVGAGGTPGNDLALRLHPNGLCVITLAPSHAGLAASRGGGAISGEQQAAAEATGQQAGDQQPEAQQAAAAAAKAGVSAEGQQSGAARTTAEQQQQQQQQQPQQQRSGPKAAAARLELAPKLLQAQFRRGRGPLLQAETVLGRQAPWLGFLRLTAGGAAYVLRCCCRGLLVELNSRLEGLQGPELLRALRESYLAIVEPRAVDVAQLAASCLSEELYRQQGGLGSTGGAADAAVAVPGGDAAAAAELAVPTPADAASALVAADAMGDAAAAATAAQAIAAPASPLPAGLAG